MNMELLKKEKNSPYDCKSILARGPNNTMLVDSNRVKNMYYIQPFKNKTKNTTSNGSTLNYQLQGKISHCK